MYIKDKISFQALSSESTQIMEPRKYHGNGKEKKYYKKLLNDIDSVDRVKFKIYDDGRIVKLNLPTKKVLTLDIYSPDNFGVFDAKKQRIYYFEKKGLLKNQFQEIFDKILNLVMKK